MGGARLGSVVAVLLLLGCGDGGTDRQLAGIGGPTLSLRVAPGDVQRGSSVILALVTGQSFFNPQSTANLTGSGVTLGPLVGGDQTHAALTVTVAEGAPQGARTLTVTTGGRRAVGTLRIGLATVAPRVMSVAPDAAPGGETLVVTITCADTSFDRVLPPQVTLYANGPVPLTAVVVDSPTVLRASLHVPPLPVGWRPLYVVDGSTVMAGLFLIGHAPGASVALTPDAAPAGATLTLQATGTRTHFIPGITRVTVPGDAGIMLGEVAVTDATHATVEAVIDGRAPVGPTALYFVTDTEVVRAGFTVLAAASITLAPAQASQGTSLTVSVTGTNTHFVAGVTTATVAEGTEIQIAALRVVGATEAEVDLVLPPSDLAAPVTRPIVVATGWEAPRADFTVLPGPRFTLNPAELAQGATALLWVQGAHTTFVAGVTQAVLPPDAGFSITDLFVLSPTVAAIQVVVDFAPPEGPRTFSLMTGAEEAIGTLTITPGAPAIRISPTSAPQGEEATITVEGRQMGFGLGTVATWLPPAAEITTVSLTISDADHLVLVTDIAATAPVGPVTLGIRTATATATAAFTIDPAPTTPTITFAPAAVRQGEVTHVVVTGEGTHFDGRTSLIFPAGSGVTAGALHVAGPTQLDADLTVTDTAAVGSLTVTAVTGGESASGTLTMETGLPQLVLAPDLVPQGAGPTEFTATACFFTFDAGTRFTVDPACDVALTSAVPHDESRADVVIDVPPFARRGSCPVTATTGTLSVVGSFVIAAGLAGTLGTDVTGTITTGARTVYVGFDASAGDLIYGRARRDPWTQLDLQLALIDVDRHTELAANDDESPATLDALVLYRIPAAGTYYFSVRDRLDVATGAFTLQLRRFAPETLAEAEPNDSDAQAQPVDLTTVRSVVIRGDLVGSDTQDRYRLQVPAGYHFAADVVARAASPFAGSAAVVTLALHLPDGTTRISTDRSYGPDPVLYYEPAADAELLLEVTRDPAADPRGGFYLLNLRPAIVVDEVYAESAGSAVGSFIELVGEPGQSLEGYTLTAGAFTHDFTGCACALGPTGLLVLAHDATAPGAAVIDASLALPAGGAVLLRRGGVLSDDFSYPATSGAYRFGRGFRIDSDAATNVITQIEESADEANYSSVP
jgi:hypothetical protein